VAGRAAPIRKDAAGNVLYKGGTSQTRTETWQ
jgi:hypothetical protein